MENVFIVHNDLGERALVKVSSEVAALSPVPFVIQESQQQGGDAIATIARLYDFASIAEQYGQRITMTSLSKLYTLAEKLTLVGMFRMTPKWVKFEFYQGVTSREIFDMFRRMLPQVLPDFAIYSIFILKGERGKITEFDCDHFISHCHDDLSRIVKDVRAIGVFKRFFYDLTQLIAPSWLTTGSPTNKAIVAHLFPSLYAKALISPWESQWTTFLGRDPVFSRLHLSTEARKEETKLTFTTFPVGSESMLFVGSSAIRSEETTLAIINSVLSEVIEPDFDWTNVLVAGGLVAKALAVDGKITESTDIDLWVPDKETHYRLLRYFENHGSLAFIRYPTLTTVVFPNTRRTVQIVQTDFKEASTEFERLGCILTHFDYSYVSAGIYNGKVFVHPRYELSCATRLELANFDKRARPHRIVKATKCGYTVFNVGIDIALYLSVSANSAEEYTKAYMSQFDEKTPVVPLFSVQDARDKVALGLSLMKYHPDGLAPFFSSMQSFDLGISKSALSYSSIRNRDLVKFVPPTKPSDSSSTIEVYNSLIHNQPLIGVLVDDYDRRLYNGNMRVVAFSKKINFSAIVAAQAVRSKAFEKFGSKLRCEFNFIDDFMFAILDNTNTQKLSGGSIVTLLPTMKYRAHDTLDNDPDKYIISISGVVKPFLGYSELINAELERVYNELSTPTGLHRMMTARGFVRDTICDIFRYSTLASIYIGYEADIQEEPIPDTEYVGDPNPTVWNGWLTDLRYFDYYNPQAGPASSQLGAPMQIPNLGSLPPIGLLPLPATSASPVPASPVPASPVPATSVASPIPVNLAGQPSPSVFPSPPASPQQQPMPLLPSPQLPAIQSLNLGSPVAQNPINAAAFLQPIQSPGNQPF